MENNNTQVKMMEGYPALQKSDKKVFLIQLSLRFLAFAAALAATLLMALSSQTVNIFGITLEAKYSFSSTFKFFLVGNAVASAYALLSIPFAFLINSKASGRSTSHFLLFLFDLMVMGMIVAAASAATAVGYLGKKGNSHMGWAPLCGQVRNFCDRVGNSISCSFAALVLYFLIVLVSASTSKA